MDRPSSPPSMASPCLLVMICWPMLQRWIIISSGRLRVSTSSRLAFYSSYLILSCSNPNSSRSSITKSEIKWIISFSVPSVSSGPAVLFCLRSSYSFKNSSDRRYSDALCCGNLAVLCRCGALLFLGLG